MPGGEAWVVAGDNDSQDNWPVSLSALNEALHPCRTRVLHPETAPESPPDLILLPYGGWQPLFATLSTCRQRWPHAPAVGLLPADEADPERLYQAFQKGLEDFVLLPARVPELIARLRWIRGERPPERAGASELEQWKRSQKLDSLVGTSPVFEQALRNVPVLGATDATVLLLGETGTGKELFARALHYSSRRRGEPFVPVNCGAVPENLFENELFGHARGAYTDAGSESAGLLSIAEGGTLFLDEVDSLSAPAQVKLLRLLQSREYRQLGSAETRIADIRVIAAANTDLANLVRRGRMREDLYYRLNVLRIVVPPLRTRAGDVLQLAQHFLERLAAQYGKSELRLGAGACSQLAAYGWPGNVRELEAVMQRAVLLATGPLVQASDLDLPSPDAIQPVDDAQGLSFREAKSALIEQFERNYLHRLLQRFGGNVSQAARAAGKERRAFQRLLARRGVREHRESVSRAQGTGASV